jgi:hypothetical protein
VYEDYIYKDKRHLIGILNAHNLANSVAAAIAMPTAKGVFFDL